MGSQGTVRRKGSSKKYRGIPGQAWWESDRQTDREITGGLGLVQECDATGEHGPTVISNPPNLLSLGFLICKTERVIPASVFCG